MPPETDGSMPKRVLESVVRSAVSARNVAMAVTGVLAGSSIALLGKDAVVVPLVGSIPGAPVGAVGLAIAFAAYRRWSCCGDCGNEECGCGDECGESCSYDP